MNDVKDYLKIMVLTPYDILTKVKGKNIPTIFLPFTSVAQLSVDN